VSVPQVVSNVLQPDGRMLCGMTCSDGVSLCSTLRASRDRCSHHDVEWTGQEVDLLTY
jgi:hypothetical protein